MLLVSKLRALTTLEPGEQSVLGATQRSLSYARQRLLLAIWTSVLFPLKFSAHILVALVSRKQFPGPPLFSSEGWFSLYTQC